MVFHATCCTSPARCTSRGECRVSRGQEWRYYGCRKFRVPSVPADEAVLRSTGTLPSWSHPRVPTTAGPPSDADVIGGAGEAADGMLVLDTANERLYVRVGGTWRWAALT